MTQLYIALDGLHEHSRQTEAIFMRLHQTGLPFGVKVNLDATLPLEYAETLSPYAKVGRNVFLDLKMWNGKRTMQSVFLGVLNFPEVKYVTAHALGDSELAYALRSMSGSSLCVAGTTILTHYDEGYCQRHFRRSRAESVRHFAEVAAEAGCRAIVLPGEYLDLVRDLNVQKIVPGIREAGAARDGRHDAEVTPEYAREHGADVVVCGSLIMKADDPVAALQRIHGKLSV